MAQQNYINEYSRAVYDLAIESKLINEFRADLIELATAFHQETEFYKIFASLSVDNDIKKELVNTIFVDHIHPILINFLFYLIDKNLEKDIIRISEKVIGFIDNKTNRVYVKIYTPFELTQTAIDTINQQLRKITNKEPISKIKIDPDLIGGIRIEYDSKVLDYTIESKIKNIKQTMKRGY